MAISPARIGGVTNIGHAYGILVTLFEFHLPDIKMSGYIIDHAYGIRRLKSNS